MAIDPAPARWTPDERASNRLFRGNWGELDPGGKRCCKGCEELDALVEIGKRGSSFTKRTANHEKESKGPPAAWTSDDESLGIGIHSVTLS